MKMVGMRLIVFFGISISIFGNKDLYAMKSAVEILEEERDLNSPVSLRLSSDAFLTKLSRFENNIKKLATALSDNDHPFEKLEVFKDFLLYFKPFLHEACDAIKAPDISVEMQGRLEKTVQVIVACRGLLNEYITYSKSEGLMNLYAGMIVASRPFKNLQYLLDQRIMQNYSSQIAHEERGNDMNQSYVVMRQEIAHASTSSSSSSSSSSFVATQSLEGFTENERDSEHDSSDSFEDESVSSCKNYCSRCCKKTISLCESITNFLSGFGERYKLD